jgi:hypothetical protein
MAIGFTCHQCGGQFAAPEPLSGKQAKCKRCGAIVTVPIVLPVEPAMLRPAAGPASPPPVPAQAMLRQSLAPPDVLADQSPRTSQYTLPPAVSGEVVPWRLIRGAVAIVVVVSAIVGLKLTVSYFWPQITEIMQSVVNPTPEWPTEEEAPVQPWPPRVPAFESPPQPPAENTPGS